MEHLEFDKLIESRPEELVSIEQVKDLEKELDFSFSDEQLDFLFSYQGVSFQSCEPVRYEGYFHSFLSLTQIEDRYRFLKTEIEQEDGIYCYTDYLLPVAETNLYSEFFCLSVSPQLTAGVWAIDYEINLDDLPKSEWKARIVHVADSVGEWLTICASSASGL